MVDPSIQAKMDYAIATGAATSPVWLSYLDDASRVFFIFGGAILLLIRIGIAWREWQRKGKRR